MDHRQLRYFLSACETGNLTAAARREHVSEQALSKGIRNLEHELGTPLFVREARGVVPSEQGFALLPEARAYIAQHEAIRTRFAARDDADDRLDLAMATGLLAQWTPPGFLSDFVMARPSLSFRLRCFSEDSYNRPRHAERPDLIVCASGPLEDGWEAKLHASRPMRLLMSKEHPLAARTALGLRDLNGHALAWAAEETAEQAEMFKRLAEVGAEPSVRFGPAEIPLVDELVRAGRLAVPFAGKAEHAPEGTVVREVEGLGAWWHLYVLAPTDRRLSRPARDLLDALRAVV